MSSEQQIDSGGSAFPKPGDCYPGNGGLSKRQWYAGMAMPSILISYAGLSSLRRACARLGLSVDDVSLEDVYAALAFKAADAMIAHEKSEVNRG